MGRKKYGGFIFESYANDHQPLHIHIFQGHRFIGRFDIVNQRPMDERLKITPGLRKALRECGYLK